MKALALVAVLLGLPALAANHPSLLFDAKDLPQIRARLAGSQKGVGDALRSGVESAFDGSGFPAKPSLSYQYFDPIAVADTTLAFAFAAVVWGDQPGDPIAAKATQVGHDYLVGVCNYSDWEFAAQQGFPGPDVNLGHFMFDVSLAYDWLYETLTPAERQACQAKMTSQGNKMYVGAKFPVASSSPWWIEQYLQNHHWVNNAALGMAGLAFAGEIPAASAWLATAQTAVGKVQTVLDLVPGGGWHEGNGYLNYGLDGIVPFSVANARAGGTDFAANQLVTDYPKLRLYAMPPAEAHRREYPVWGDFSGFQDHGMVLTLRYVARAQRSGLAAWAAQRYESGKAQGVARFSTWPPAMRGVLLSTLLADDTVAPTPPASVGAWALDYKASDLGLVLGRSGWEDEAGSLLAFKSGVYGGHGNFQRMLEKGAPGGGLNFSHNHADDMSVYLFADGEWQTSNVPGYFIGRNNGAPQANKTRYANSLLVDGAGQIGEGVRAEDYRAAPWFFSRKSSIPLCGSTSNYSFTQGKGEELYPEAAGLTRFERSVLFAERAFPIVRDVVRSSGSHRFEITYHAMDAVAQDGQWLKLSGKNDRVLGVRVVSPASFALATEAQTTTHLQKFDPDGNMTAAFVRPTANSGEVTFLTALVPSRGSNWAARPQVAPIDPGVPERGLTVTGFSGAQRLDVVFNDDPGATSSAAGVEVTGMAGVKKSDGSKVLRAMLASGQRLVIDGKAWIEVVGAGPASFEVEPVSGGIEVSGDRVPARFYAPGASTVRFNGVDVPFKRVGDFVDVAGDKAPGAGTGTGELLDSGCSTFGPTSGGEGPSGGSGQAPSQSVLPEGGAGCASTQGSPWLLAAFALLPLALHRRVRALVAVRARRPRRG